MKEIVEINCGDRFFTKKSFEIHSRSFESNEIYESDMTFTIEKESVIYINSDADLDPVFDYIYDMANLASHEDAISIFNNIKNTYTIIHDSIKAEIAICFLIAYYRFRHDIKQNYMQIYESLSNYFKLTGENAEEILLGLDIEE